MGIVLGLLHFQSNPRFQGDDKAPAYNLLTRVLLASLRKDQNMSISVELTTACNMSCSICIRKDISLEPQHMSLEQLKLIVSGLQEHSFVIPNKDTISVVGLGEPLLYPHLKEALEILHSSFPHNSIVLNTNAFLLNKYGTMLKETMNKNDILVFSINASNAKSYAKYMNSNNFYGVCKNVNEFLESYQGKPRIFLRYLKVPENDFGQFRKLWHLKSNPNVTSSKHPLLHWQTDRPITRLRYACPSLWGGVILDVKGNCYPCCKAYATREKSSLLIGSITDKAIKGLYREKVESFRISHLKKTYPSDCLYCDFWRESTVVWRIRAKLGMLTCTA